MITPIKNITLRDDHVNDTHIRVDVYISDNGDLVIDGCDTGKAPEQFWGDTDYEYITTIKSEFRDTVLLLLIKEKFRDSSDFQQWLETNAIPSDFFTWV